MLQQKRTNVRYRRVPEKMGECGTKSTQTDLPWMAGKELLSLRNKGKHRCKLDRGWLPTLTMGTAKSLEIQIIMFQSIIKHGIKSRQYTFK